MKMTMAVAAHKQVWVPEDDLYLPMEVGAALREQHLTCPSGRPMQRDDEGENISRRNACYCELTALYRLWKGCDADVLGLCHYRRYFAPKRFGDKRSRIMTPAQARQLMENADVLLPKKRHYYIQTGYDQYAHAHHEQDLLVTRQVLQELGPRYAAAFDRTLKSTSGHRFNVMLMRREPFMAYCEWLFGVLAQVAARLDLTGYTASDLRVFGYLGERLLDVWLLADGHGLRVRECPVVNLESQHWPRKILSFLMRMLRPARR